MLSIPRIVIADPIAAAAEKILRDHAKVQRVAGTRRAELLDAVAHADALIVRSATNVDAEVFQAAAKLQVVGRAGVGVDNIDLEAARAHGVTVVNTPTANIHSACEHAIALLLATARHIPAADTSVHAGGWQRSRFTGVEVFGKTVGVIGFGRVGQLFAERIAAFGTTVVVADPYPDHAAAERIGVRFVGLEELMAVSDFVSVHVPKTPETHGLIGTRLLTHAKPGQILVNAARGGVVDEHALANALRDGRIRAAGIDVFDHEPPKDSPLLGLDNVVATPHLGAATAEAQDRAGTGIAHAVLEVLDGRDAPGVVVKR